MLLVLLFGAVSAAPISKTIVDLAVANPDLSIFVALVKAGALVDTLSGPGPFTVFAPSNESFAMWPKGYLEKLLDPKNKQSKFIDTLLTYHVVAGEIHTKDVKLDRLLETVEGKDVLMIKDDTTVTVNGVHITTADVDASNGVVHIINQVLMWPGIVYPDLPSLAVPAFGIPTFLSRPSASSLAESNTIVDLAVANPDLSTLVAALKAGALVDTLSGPGPFTVFAPTNFAFNELPKDFLAALLEPKNKEFLVKVLTYHVVPASIHTKDLKEGSQPFKTVEGTELNVIHSDKPGGPHATFLSCKMCYSTGHYITVHPADVDASNGVVQIIDQVLIPPDFVWPSASSLVASNTIVDLAVDRAPTGSPTGCCDSYQTYNGR